MKKTLPQISKNSLHNLQKLKGLKSADQSRQQIIPASVARHLSRKENLATRFRSDTFTKERGGLITSPNSSSKRRKKAVRKKIKKYLLKELKSCSKAFIKARHASWLCKKGPSEKTQQERRITTKNSKRLKVDDSDEDDATRIKRRVKYLLMQMNKEQSLIDVYSAEGWKGQSREKLRPERELQKAKAQILRFQLRIRDALHELELLGLEGTLKEYIFDSHGQIYHEDIFCAVCKRQDVTTNNDIILCDGACDRAFHQLCLRPPLRTDEIPPDDEGWLCPLCNCKLECLDAVNAYFGTSYDVQDPWEKIFSEVDSFGSNHGKLSPEVQDWPSEDSGDADFEPGNANRHVSSDESVSLVNSDQWGLSIDANEEHTVLMDGKRQRKDVDYNKLHDEMFGETKLLDDASEDEEWGPRKGLGMPKKLLQQRCSFGGSLQKTVLTESSPLPQNKQKKVFLSPDVVKKLQAAFKENPLPSRACKEELSKQLGLPFGKVHVWFKNVRCAALKKGLIYSAKGKYTDLLDPTTSSTVRDKSPSSLFEKSRQKHSWISLMNMVDLAQLKLETLRSTLYQEESIGQDSGSLMYVAVPELRERTKT